MGMIYVNINNDQVLHCHVTNISAHPVSAFGLPAPDMKISRVSEESEIVFKPRVVTTGTTSTASFTLKNPEVGQPTFESE